MANGVQFVYTGDGVDYGESWCALRVRKWASVRAASLVSAGCSNRDQGVEATCREVTEEHGCPAVAFMVCFYCAEIWGPNMAAI